MATETICDRCGRKDAFRVCLYMSTSSGVASGTMRVTDPRQVARAMLSMAVDVARWYHPGRRETPASIGALYADLATRMVGAEE